MFFYAEPFYRSGNGTKTLLGFNFMTPERLIFYLERNIHNQYFMSVPTDLELVNPPTSDTLKALRKIEDEIWADSLLSEQQKLKQVYNLNDKFEKTHAVPYFIRHEDGFNHYAFDKYTLTWHGIIECVSNLNNPFQPDFKTAVRRAYVNYCNIK